MKLSIGMCTYNGALYLQEQLDSIAAQTRLPDELVVCDDRSSDGTRKMIEAFAAKAPFPVRLYVNEKNLGPTKNFEKVIGLCEREIIALSDQDDVWCPEKLKRIEAKFSLTPRIGLVFSDAEIVDENLRPLGYRAWQCDSVEFGRKEQKLFKEGRALDVLLTRTIITGCSMAFRSRFKELILPFPDNLQGLIHDGWIALMIAAVANLAFIHEPQVKYRRHPKQFAGLLPPARNDTAQNGSEQQNRFYSTHVSWINLLYENLSARCDIPTYKEAISDLSKIEARLSHLQRRAKLHRKKIVNRVPGVLKELLTFQYHLYSNGVFSAAEDLLPHRIILATPLRKNVHTILSHYRD